jgi:hypothetical protein
MAQVNSENSIAMPVDPTRRRFITIAVGASVGSLAAVAMPASTGPETQHDPIFGMIEAYRKAEAAHRAALDEQNRLELLGDPLADSVSEQRCHDEFNAFDALLSAAATTVPGILAQLAYLQGIAESDAWMFDDRADTGPRLIKGFAASIANVLAVQS